MLLIKRLQGSINQTSAKGRNGIASVVGGYASLMLRWIHGFKDDRSFSVR